MCAANEKFKGSCKQDLISGVHCKNVETSQKIKLLLSNDNRICLVHGSQNNESAGVQFVCIRPFLSTVSGIEVLVSLRLNSQNPFSVHFHVWVSSSNVNPARVRHSLQPNFTEKRHREQPSTMPGGMMTALALAFGAPLATGPGGFGAAAAALGGTPLLLAFDLETAFGAAAGRFKPRFLKESLVV